MVFFGFLKKKVQSTKLLFSKSAREEAFLNEIQSSHSSLSSHLEAVKVKINSGEDISSIESHLTQMLDEFKNVLKLGEDLRTEEVDLFVELKQLIVDKVSDIKLFLEHLILDVPVSLQVHTDFKQIRVLIDRIVNELGEVVLSLEKTFANDMQSEELVFSNKMNDDLLNQGLDVIQQKRDLAHQALQEAIQRVTISVESLEGAINDSTLLQDEVKYTQVFELREQLKTLSICIHERVGVSNMLILLSFQEEIKHASAIEEMLRTIEHLESELSPAIFEELKFSINHLNSLIENIKSQSAQMIKVSKKQSQGLFSKIGTNVGLNIASNGGYGMYRLGKIVYSNAKEFKPTLKYLQRKAEEVGAKDIQSFLKSHPEFKELVSAQLVIVYFSVFQKYSDKLPKWSLKLFPKTDIKSVLGAKSVVDEFASKFSPSQLAAVAGIVSVACISMCMISKVMGSFSEGVI